MGSYCFYLANLRSGTRVTYKLKLLTNFDVNMTSFLGGDPNYELNLYFIIPRKNDVRSISKFVKSSIS